MNKSQTKDDAPSVSIAKKNFHLSK